MKKHIFNSNELKTCGNFGIFDRKQYSSETDEDVSRKYAVIRIYAINILIYSSKYRDDPQFENIIYIYYKLLFSTGNNIFYDVCYNNHTV